MNTDNSSKQECIDNNPDKSVLFENLIKNAEPGDLLVCTPNPQRATARTGSAPYFILILSVSPWKSTPMWGASSWGPPITKKCEIRGLAAGDKHISNKKVFCFFLNCIEDSYELIKGKQNKS